MRTDCQGAFGVRCRRADGAGRKAAKCSATPMGPMPGPPPPWGMQKVLCRLRWQTSAPMSPGPAQADLRVHVRAVHVDLAAVRVNDLADVLDAFFEHAVRGGVGDHQARRVRRRAARLWLCRSATSMLPLSSQATATTLKPAIDRAGGIGAVGGGRDEADVAMAFAARFVIGADGEQAGVFALRAGVGLQGDGGKAGDLGEPVLEVVEQRLVALASARPARTDACGRTPAR